MDRDKEIASLVMQQAREDTPFQPREPFVAFSIDHTPLGLGLTWSDFLDQDGKFYLNLGWGPWAECDLHGRKYMTIDAAGIPRCSACNRDYREQRRRAKGVPTAAELGRNANGSFAATGPMCGHDPSNFRSVGKTNAIRCRICDRRRDREYYKRTKIREGRGYEGTTGSPVLTQEA